MKGHIFFSSFRLVRSIQNIFLCFDLVLSVEIVSYYYHLFICHILLFMFFLCYFLMMSGGGGFTVFSEHFLISVCLFRTGHLSLCSNDHLPRHHFFSSGESEASMPHREFLCITGFLLGEFAFISFHFTSIGIC